MVFNYYHYNYIILFNLLLSAMIAYYLFTLKFFYFVFYLMLLIKLLYFLIISLIDMAKITLHQISKL